MAGASNTGGGGGGGGYGNNNADQAGGQGGSGIVVVRYLAATTSPGIQNRAVTGVSAGGATFNGTLTSTGASACAVGVYWGTDTNAWGNTNWFNEGAVNSAWTNNTPFSTNISLSPNTTYYYTYVASNTASNVVASSPVMLITGDVTLQATDATASWAAGDTGVFAIARSADLTNAGLVVNYTVGGTAAGGTDYSNIASSVTLQAGQSNATVTIAPIIAGAPGGSKTVTLTLTPGAFVMGTPSNGTVTILRQARTIYVATNGTNDVANDFNTWAGAATNINAAVAIAGTYDTVLVSNGVHTVTNELAITNAVSIQGFSTREATVITRGPGDKRLFNLSHSNAVVSSLTVSNGYMQAEGAGFKMTAGTISNVVVSHCNSYNGWNSGGGVYMTGGQVVDSVIKNCDNQAGYAAGGSAVSMSGGELRNVLMYNNGLIASAKGTVVISGGSMRSCIVTNNRGTATAGVSLSGAATLMENCLIASNTATDASGAVGGLRMSNGRAVHVTVANNTAPGATTAGGVYVTGGRITNSIAWGNLLGGAANNMPGGDSYARYSTASELTVTNGNKNNDPLFTTAGGVPYGLALASPCADAGTNLAGVAFDLAGANRVIDGNGDTVAIADMGCYEAPTPAPGTLSVSIESLSAVSGIGPLDVVLKANPAGDNTTITWYGWDLDGNGAPELTGGALGQITNTFNPGLFTVRLWITNSVGTGASAVSSNLVNVVGSNIYVSAGGTHESPYHTLGKAATNLQAALDVALAGCTVIVDEGVYRLNSHYQYTKKLTVRGIGARESTVITRGAADTRLFYLSHTNAVLSSLTISNGYVQANGAGFYMTDGTISNVVVTHCHAYNQWCSGGGGYMTGGQVVDSVIKNCDNKDTYSGYPGGGAVCMSGGSLSNVLMHSNGRVGSRWGTVYISGGSMSRCIVTNNLGVETAGVNLSGSGRIENCLIASNTATHATSGVGGLRMTGGRIVNVTVANNTAPGGATAGGVYRTGGAVTNSIMWGNRLGTVEGGYSGSVASVWYSCAPELTHGSQGNTTNNPAFTDAAGGDYTLTAFSPAKNAGTNLNWTTNDFDLAGASRLFGDYIDMGAYEFSVAIGVGGAPSITNLAVTGVTTNGATFNGWLLSTGSSACAIGVYWGPNDGSTNASQWANTNWFNSGAVNPAYADFTTFGTNISLGANQTYYYTYVASNAGGVRIAAPSVPLITGGVTLQATDASASYAAGDTGTFTVSRGASLTNVDLAVNYTVGGSAVEGTDYSNLVHSVTIPAGATNATITIWPIKNPPPGASVGASLTLASGAYAIGNPSNDTVTITKVGNTIYVTTNGTGSGASWADPTSLTNGIAIAGAYDRILVSNGLYMVTNALTITNIVSLQGFSTREATVIARATGDMRMFNLSNTNAVVHTLTVSNGYTAGFDGAGFRMTAGTISNVVVTHCNAANGWNSGGGVAMSAGQVVDSVIKNCDNDGTFYAGGSAVSMSGGELRNVLMYNNGLIASKKGTVVISGGSMRSCIVTNNRGTATAGVSLSGATTLMENCLIASNTATDASGAVGGLRMSSGRAVHVTVANNTAPGATAAGGVYVTGGWITNSIAWGNLLGGVANNMPGGDAYARYSTASELTVANGNKNSDPLFTTVDGIRYRLSSSSPCVDAGTNLVGISYDLAGTNRVVDGNGDTVAIADMGCYESPELAAGSLEVSIEALSAVSGIGPMDVILKANLVGANTTITWYGWDLDGNGAPELTGGALGQITNTFYPGIYTVSLWVTNSADNGASAVSSNLVNVVGTNVYVSAGGTHESPYHTLGKAATNLQAALDVALAGCTVIVDEGVYGLNSQYQFTKKLTVRGIGARESTVITRGAADTRLFYLSHTNAVLNSLTISNGYYTGNGAGFYMTDGMISNVVVTHCHAYNQWCSGGGGWMSGGQVVDSVIKNCDNKDTYQGYPGGGAIYMEGGGLTNVLMHSNGRVGSRWGAVYISGGSMSRCIVTNNLGVETAGVNLSGSGRIENCLIASNSATHASTGVGGIRQSGGRLVNVTVMNNTASNGATAGGVYQTGGAVTNSIMWGNRLGMAEGGYSGSVAAVWYSCAPELTHGSQGNITNNPQFVSLATGDYTLQDTSPCVDAGTEVTGMTLDLAGGARARDGNGDHVVVIDMGAYELPINWRGSVFRMR